jgi:hypothetical protein
MRHLFGIDDHAWRATRSPAMVLLDTKRLINGHMLVAGMSGTGKSFQLMRLLDSAAREKIECDVFDVHEELHTGPATRACKFSEATQLGYNPLVPNFDEHSGGIRRQISEVVDMINRTSTKLGPRQESALKNLLADVYYLRGMYADNPRTWSKRIITEAQYDEMVRNREYVAMKACQPILRDVISYAERKLKALSTGSDSKTVNALEKVEQISRNMNRIKTKQGKAADDSEIAQLAKQLEGEREKAIEAYVNFINSIETGREYTEAIKYTNRETLQSLLERLQSLQDSGIFRSNPPDWGDALIRVYQVGALKDDERKLLFYTRCQAILRECMDLGKTDDVRRIVLADEGHLYYSEDGDNPINRIAKEGRKFGLALVVGSQSPTHFSEDFLTNCGTVMLTGIHSQYWDGACRKLKVDRPVLEATRPREIAAIKMQGLGEATSRFQCVNVNTEEVAEAVRLFKQRRAPSAPQTVAA